MIGIKKVEFGAKSGRILLIDPPNDSMLVNALMDS